MAIKVIIKKCRLSYPALFKPREVEGGDAKYQATILIPKTDMKTYQAVMSAIQQEMAAASLPSGAWRGAQPPNPMLPIYDGDKVQPRSGKPWGDECKGHWVLRSSSTTAPDIVDGAGNKAMDATMFYAGCYCHYSVTIKAYNNKQLGVGAYLNCVMFVQDGDPLESRASARDDFAALIAAQSGQAPTGMPATPAFAPVYPQAPAAPVPSAPAYPTAPAQAFSAPGMASAAPVAQPPVAPAAQPPAGYGGFYGIPGMPQM